VPKNSPAGSFNRLEQPGHLQVKKENPSERETRAHWG